jgi:nucleotide-binding universal stress UspA family protein
VVYSVDLLGAMEDAARLYLDRVAQGLGGLKVTTSLRLGGAADQLLEHLEEKPAELVIMGTSGKGGLVRTALGSVTDRALHGPAPVLVFRPDESKSGLVVAAKASANA